MSCSDLKDAYRVAESLPPTLKKSKRITLDSDRTRSRTIAPKQLDQSSWPALQEGLGQMPTKRS